jgi:hypothetical protein
MPITPINLNPILLLSVFIGAQSVANYSLNSAGFRIPPQIPPSIAVEDLIAGAGLTPATFLHD